MAERVFVEITDAAGRVSPEFVVAETLPGGPVRFVRDDGSYWVFPDGPELVRAVAPDAEEQAS